MEERTIRVRNSQRIAGLSWWYEDSRCRKSSSKKSFVYRLLLDDPKLSAASGCHARVSIESLFPPPLLKKPREMAPMWHPQRSSTLRHPQLDCLSIALGTLRGIVPPASDLPGAEWGTCVPDLDTCRFPYGGLKNRSSLSGASVLHTDPSWIEFAIDPRLDSKVLSFDALRYTFPSFFGTTFVSQALLDFSMMLSLWFGMVRVK